MLDFRTPFIIRPEYLGIHVGLIVPCFATGGGLRMYLCFALKEARPTFLSGESFFLASGVCRPFKPRCQNPLRLGLRRGYLDLIPHEMTIKG